MESSILSQNTAVIYHVLRSIDNPVDLARAVAVSRLWRDVASVPSLWMALMEQEQQAASLPSKNTALKALKEEIASIHVAAGDPCREPSVAAGQQISEQHNRFPLQTVPLPKELLQPPWDTMKSPAEQVCRWLGIRRLVSRAHRLEGVGGACAAYVPATARLVVLDQNQQNITFMNFDVIVGSSWADDDCEGSSSPGHEGAVSEVGRHLGELRLSVPHHAGSAVMVHVYVPEICPQGADSGTSESIRGAELPPELFAAAPAPAPAGPMVEDVPVAVPEMDQQQLQWHEDVAADLQPDEQRKLQVIAACGGGFVATGHPDGRVLVWDSARAALTYSLPTVEGCGHGPVHVLAAEEGLLAVAYRREVLVWDLSLPLLNRETAGGRSGGSGYNQQRPSNTLLPPSLLTTFGTSPVPGTTCDGAVRHCCLAAPSARLVALIKPTLGTAIRSMALSAHHGVLALRSWDGVELREARGGRWLHSLPDRRNTALLAAGDVLFVASSSPSFLGNSFLDFQLEVATIDLPAMKAATAVSSAGSSGEAMAAVGVEGFPRNAAPGATAGEGAVPACAPAAAPLVVRTMSPILRYELRQPPLSEFKWDQPMQICLTGGLLLLRCLQFPVAQGKLAWPGMFAYRLGDLLEGLALGRRTAQAAPAPASTTQESMHSSQRSHEQQQNVPSGAAVPQQPQHANSPAALQQPVHPPAATSTSAAVGANNVAAPAPKPPSEVVSCHVREPEVFCGDGGFATLNPVFKGSPDVFNRHSIASAQLLATPQHLVVLSESQEVFVMQIPYCGPRRQM